MASKISNAIIDGDALIITKLSKYLRYSKDEIKTLVKASKKGIIAVETLVEEAISKVAKVKRSSIDGEDFVNGWDAKKGTVNWHGAGSKSPIRKCSIGTKNKTGDLVCVIADPIANEIFYFKIPKSEYCDFPQVKITFSDTGGMPSSLREGGFSWKMWNLYRKKSFRELCKNC